MSTAITRKIYAKLFFAIFFAKMVISTAPILIHNFDKDALLQIVLQLEIENNNGKSGLDIFAKGYFGLALGISLQPPANFIIERNLVKSDARHIRAFYPSVPTPPPNRLV